MRAILLASATADHFGGSVRQPSRLAKLAPVCRGGRGLRGKIAPIRHLAALRSGPMISTVASAKSALRAIARRWLTLDAEIKAHDADLEALTTA
jgi:hypothetical protein